MARKPNYDFEKRKKEQDRKAKKDAKRAERQQRRDDRKTGVLVEDEFGNPIVDSDDAEGEGDEETSDPNPESGEPGSR